MATAVLHDDYAQRLMEGIPLAYDMCVTLGPSISHPIYLRHTSELARIPCHSYTLIICFSCIAHCLFLQLQHYIDTHLLIVLPHSSLLFYFLPSLPDREMDHAANSVELQEGEDETLMMYKIYRRKLQHFLKVVLTNNCSTA